ncbi:hypothetical protein ERJ75_001076600 [Trypanosoma vivax]|nr:hypothetical protein ERJ75_001076600 [Trypanosoma vivax]
MFPLAWLLPRTPADCHRRLSHRPPNVIVHVGSDVHAGSRRSWACFSCRATAAASRSRSLLLLAGVSTHGVWCASQDRPVRHSRLASVVCPVSGSASLIARHGWPGAASSPCGQPSRGFPPLRAQAFPRWPRPATSKAHSFTRVLVYAFGARLGCHSGPFARAQTADARERLGSVRSAHAMGRASCRSALLTEASPQRCPTGGNSFAKDMTTTPLLAALRAKNRRSTRWGLDGGKARRVPERHRRSRRAAMAREVPMRT